MPPTLIELEVALERLGVEEATPDADALARLLDAISAQIRRRTRRAFEGDEGGSYDERYRLDGAREFRLRNVPVGAITSIRRVYRDWAEDTVYTSTLYRIVDAERGIVELNSSVGRPWSVRVIYTTTGDIDPEISQAASDWLEARWQDGGRDYALASYRTGDDSESYNLKLAGRVPPEVEGVLAGFYRSRSGGPI